MTIYQPAEDSYLMQDVLKDYLKGKSKSIKILDMGSGNGILAESCRDSGFKDVLAVDVNEEAVKFLKERGFKSIKSDLFSEVKGKFDLIIFNPPYLPFDVREPEDSQIQTTGGKEGYEIIVRFLLGMDKNLLEKGVLLLLFSSLSNPDVILKEAKRLGYDVKLLGKKKLFFEELFVYRIYKK